MKQAAETKFDVVILGAGMAGLAAARSLGERGLRVCVLEAQQRVGGRILSVAVEGGGWVELGAEFVHGRPPELWALIEEAGVETVERDGSMLREGWGGGLEDDDPEDDAMFAPLKALEDFEGEDIAFWDWLKNSDVPKPERAALLGYVEGFNAADARRISVKALGIQQKAEDATGGDRAWHIVQGYARLPEFLAGRVREQGGEIRLGSEVRGVRWAAGEVCAETSLGDVSASHCIVALPLGVVQRVNHEHGIWMEPEPAAVDQSRRLAMGTAERFTLVFRETWWTQSHRLEQQKLQSMSFLFTPKRMPPVWWSAVPEPETLPTLTGWVGGPQAKALRGKGAEELGEAACAALAEIFELDPDVIRGALVAVHRHDWAGDPWSHGAYSYVPAGAAGASAAMAAPEAATMYFAGEHTDVTGHWGTVHAALRSGLRAAEQILKDLQHESAAAAS